MARRRRYAEHREWRPRSSVPLLGTALNRPMVFLFILMAMPQLDTVFGGDTNAVDMATTWPCRPAAGAGQPPVRVSGGTGERGSPSLRCHPALPPLA